jgi:hypothetical protein
VSDFGLDLQAPVPADLSASLAPGAYAPAAVTPDLVDRKLTALLSLEKVLPVPALPDEVRLDLATSDLFADENELSSFLGGVAADIRSATEPSAEPPGGDLLVPDASPAGRVLLASPTAGISRTRDFIDALAGRGSVTGAEVLSPDAVVDFKRDAVRRGLLPADTPLDRRWDPSLVSAFYDRRSQEFSEAIGGDRPGAISLGGALELADKWLSPTGLLSAAMAMDLVWNPSEIAREAREWDVGEGIKKLGGWFKDPLDFGKAGDALDTVLGPIDEIVMPTLNLLMLVNGVSSVVAFSRVARALKAGGALGETLRVGGSIGGALGALPGVRTTFQVADVAADVGRFTKASVLAQRSMNSRFSVLNAVGEGMGAWRRFTTTATIRKAVQKGMQLGVSGQIQGALAGADDVGIGIAGVGTFEDRYSAVRRAARSNPLTFAVSQALEIPFAPTTLVTPGSVGRTVRRASGLLVRGADRAGFGDIRRAFAGLNDDARLTIAAGESLLAMAPDAATRALYEQSLRRGGHRRLVVDVLGQGDEARAGEMMVWGMTVAAARKHAHAMAASMVADPDSIPYARLVGLYRGNILAQLKWLDLDPAELDTAAGVRRYLHVRSGLDSTDMVDAPVLGARKAAYRRLKEAFEADPEAFRAQARMELSQRELNRQAAWHEIVAGVDEDDFIGALVDMYPTMTDWPAFSSAMGEIEDTVQFRPEHIRVTGVAAAFRPDSVVSEMDAALRGVLDVPFDPRSHTPNGLRAHIDHLMEATSDGRGVVTAARADSPTLQEWSVLEGRVAQLLRRRDAMAAVGRNEGAVYESLASYAGRLSGADGAPLAVSELTDAQRSAWAAEAAEALGLSASDLDAYSSAAVWTRSYADDVRTPAQVIDEALTEINGSRVWARFGITGRSIEDKLARGRQGAEFLAAEVTVPAELRDRLAALGYKAVRGVDFLMGQDIVGIEGPLAHVRWYDRFAHSFGTFAGRVDNLALTRAKQDRFRQVIGPELARVVATKGRSVYRNGIDPTDADIAPDGHVTTEILDELDRAWDELGVGLDGTAVASHDPIGRFAGRVLRNTQPRSRWHMREAAVRAHMQRHLGMTREGAAAVTAAMRKANDVGFRYRGLASIEDHIVANSALRGFLRNFERQGGRYSGATIGSVLADYRGTRSGPLAGVLESTGASRAWWADNFAYQTRRSGPAARVAGAALGAGLGATQYESTDGEPSVEAALFGALGGAIGGRRIVNPRLVARAGAGILAARTAEGADIDPKIGFALGAFGTVPAASKIATGLNRSGGLLDKLNMASYGRLSDAAVHARNVFRFSLSPIFDLQRYTESAVLGATGMGADVPLTTNYWSSLGRWARRSDVDLGDYSSPAELLAATRTMFYEHTALAMGRDVRRSMDLVDDTDRWMRDVGILGFNPHEQYAGAFGFLVHRSGMDPTEAAAKVWNTMTYGVKGPAPWEQSVNFIFFPFSFTKKYVTQAAKFLSDDLSRLVIAHDALKTWDKVWAETDMSQRWRDYLPILGTLRKLNAFQLGISPGELGGINRPLYEMFKDVPVGSEIDAAVMNLFVPQAVRIRTEEDRRTLTDTVQRVIPIWRDVIKNVVDEDGDLRQQWAVIEGLTGASQALSTRSQVSQGWQAYADIRRRYASRARLFDVSLTGLLGSDNPFHRIVGNEYRSEILDLEERFPGWREDRDESVARAVARQRNLEYITARPSTEGEAALSAFRRQVDVQLAILGMAGVSVSDPEEIPTSTFVTVQNAAIAWAARVPSFLPLYDEFYMRQWGDITERVRR